MGRWSREWVTITRETNIHSTTSGTGGGHLPHLLPAFIKSWCSLKISLWGSYWFPVASPRANLYVLLTSHAVGAPFFCHFCSCCLDYCWHKQVSLTCAQVQYWWIFPMRSRDWTSGFLLPPEMEYSYSCHQLWFLPSVVTQRVTAEVRSSLSRPQLQLILFSETGDFTHHFHISLIRQLSGVTPTDESHKLGGSIWVKTQPLHLELIMYFDFDLLFN